MELRHIYKLAEIINEYGKENSLGKSFLNDIGITVKVSPTTHFGIDKEFYRMTHNDNIDGFEHKDVINAKIDGIDFVILDKSKEDK